MSAFVKVIAKQPARRRAGMLFGLSPIALVVAELPEGALAALDGDPQLVVTSIEESEFLEIEAGRHAIAPVADAPERPPAEFKVFTFSDLSLTLVLTGHEHDEEMLLDAGLVFDRLSSNASQASQLNDTIADLEGKLRTRDDELNATKAALAAAEEKLAALPPAVAPGEDAAAAEGEDKKAETTSPKKKG